ncbi:MAG: NUDIX domain-containing protein [Terrimicrobiaceae bacterium]
MKPEEYPLYGVAVDCVVFGLDHTPRLEVLLMRRENEPFTGRWALPGVFVREKENAEEAARRALSTKTGLSCGYLEQLATFSDPDRDPRGRVISVAYYALVTPQHEPAAQPASFSTEARWWDLERCPKLPFDHRAILDAALERLRGKLSYRPIGIELLPEKFTMPQLRAVYHAMLQRRTDPANFRRKMLPTGLLKDTGERVGDPRGGRPAVVYSFDRGRYERLLKSGFTLDI